MASWRHGEMVTCPVREPVSVAVEVEVELEQSLLSENAVVAVLH